VGKEIFQRGEQERTEPAFLSIDAGIDFVFDQISEKALREILRIIDAIATASYETVKRCPIGLAKLRERRFRNHRLGLASPSRKNRTPMRRRKQIRTLAIPALYQRPHICALYQAHIKKASGKKC